MTSQAEKGAAFRDLHLGPDIFLMPNAWDEGSAKILAASGVSALATTSGGVNWARGREDYIYEVPKAEMLAAYGQIARAVDLPVSGDLENGYGDTTEDVAETIRMAIAKGMVGGGIEDSTADPAKPLFDEAEAVDRIRAARTAADESGIPFTLTARCEAFCFDVPDPLGTAIRRGNLFREAGADCIFIPGPNDAAIIGTIVREIDAPISQVVGLGDPPVTVAMLRDLGVRRISTGGSLARGCLGYLQRAARTMVDEGTFGYAAEAVSDPAINDFMRAAK